MTPEDLRSHARWSRNDGFIGLADYLDAQADIIEAAAAPAQPAAVEPRCDRCRWWVLHARGTDGACRRFPPVVLPEDQQHPAVAPFHWCGEFTPQEVTP